MQLTNYKYVDSDQAHQSGWKYESVSLEKVNLLVGDTASGKSKFLNTIFNLARLVARGEFYAGKWKLSFNHAGSNYTYALTSRTESGIARIISEKLTLHGEENDTVIIARMNDECEYNGAPMPKLEKDKSLITILKENDDVAQIYSAFTLVMKRNFDGDILHISRQHHAIDGDIDQTFKGDDGLEQLFLMSPPINVKMFLLDKYFPDIFTEVKELFKECFSFVQDIQITDLRDTGRLVTTSANVPVFLIKEKGLPNGILYSNISSGMLKVLILITDMLTLPEGASYLIDEYENSLGMSAINFFPTLLEEASDDQQFIITSHHPYIINRMPVSNWIVFKRSGSDVQSMCGNHLVEYLGKSKQQAFVKLVNSPFYSGD